MSTGRKLLLGIAALVGGFVLLCVLLIVGTTALSAIGILPTPEPTVARTPRPTQTPKATATPAQFVHDPVRSPGYSQSFSFRVYSAGWVTRADLPNRPGERWLSLLVQISPNQSASKSYQGGVVYESSFRLTVGDREIAPDKAARETMDSKGFGDTLGTSVTSIQRRTLVFSVPDTEEHFGLRVDSSRAYPISFTLRLPASATPLPSALPVVAPTPGATGED